jgi:hypothetical protein
MARSESLGVMARSDVSAVPHCTVRLTMVGFRQLRHHAQTAEEPKYGLLPASRFKHLSWGFTCELGIQFAWPNENALCDGIVRGRTGY